MQCPLCESTKSQLWYQDKRREYIRCNSCDLIFVPAIYHLSFQDEKDEYDKHQNLVDDPGYRNFLAHLSKPVSKFLSNDSHILDFGCGPGPALASMFREMGYKVSLFDPFYASDKSVLQNQYDLITATEVFEHLRNPAETIRDLVSLLNPGGILGIMTKLHIDDCERFAQWHYINDPTHIVFYSAKTLIYIAKRYNLTLMPVADDAFLFLDAGAANLV